MMSQQPSAWAGGRWLVLLGCFIGLVVSANNSVMTPYGVYLKPVITEFGWSRGQFSFGVSVIALSSALCMPLVGWCLDRFGSRRVVLTGCALLPLVMVIYSYLPGNYALYMGVCVLLGLGLAWTSTAAYLSVPPQWFDRNLGLALALAGSGLGIGQILLVPLIQHLVTLYGWRTTWLIMAGIIAAAGLINAYLLIRDNPDFQRARTQQVVDTAVLTGDEFSIAIRSPLFWLITAPYVLVALVYTGIVTQMIPLLTDRGFTTAQASGVMVALGIASLSARVVAGALLDRISFAVVGGVFFVLQALGFVILSGGQLGIWPYVAAALIGAGMGAESDLLPFTLRRVFGMRSFGRLIGIAVAIFQLGPIFGPVLLSTTFDITGSYRPMLNVFAFLSTLAALLLVLAALLRGRLGRQQSLA